MRKREEIIQKIDKIPSIPPTIAKVQKLVNDPDVDFKELAELIKYDQGLTADVLKMANSAYFGFQREISSVKQAIIMLGLDRIFELTLSSAVAPIIDRKVSGYDLSKGDLWKHSIGVAISSEKIAEELNMKVPKLTFTAGLLIDIGKVAMSTFLDTDPKPIMDLAYEKQIPFDIAERRILGISHEEAGAILLENWNLPEELIQVVRWHHQPNRVEGDKTVVDLVHIADILIMETGIGGGSDGLNY
ncbi:MAG: HDOD domain-containing protein, partial [Candidatus Marinimicrobia bacterium]|nr:HDOD domain-containing protein [Candidatus Neomarinimicrobiota bacterium]